VDKPTPAWLKDAQAKWTNRGDARPPFALEPGPGQESVWDYPRPPAVVPDAREVIVGSTDHPAGIVAHTSNAQRLLETASPPTFYLPAESITAGTLVSVGGSSMCEWKGPADYFALAVAPDVPVAWTYRSPFNAYAALAGWVAFYPGRVPCTVDGVTVKPQAGGFYGGWVTPEVVGPFKGDPGTGGW